MPDNGDHFYEAVRTFAHDVVRALGRIVGLKQLSAETGISVAMLSRYTRRRSKPSRSYMHRLLRYIDVNSEELLRAAARSFIAEPVQRDMQILLATVIANQFRGSIDLVVGLLDVTFPVAVLVSTFLDRPLGSAWYEGASIPRSMKCVLEGCGGGQRLACYSIPQLSGGESSVFIVSPFAPNCISHAVRRHLERIGATVKVLNLASYINE